MLERAQDTERYIIRSAGATTDYGDYVVTQSRGYPNWYQANMMELRVSRGRSLGDWERLFNSHFDRRLYQHLMLYIPERAAFALLEDEINELLSTHRRCSPTLIVERITWMFANRARHFILPTGMEVCRIASEEEFQDLIEFGVEEAAGAHWFTSKADVRAFIESRLESTDRIGVIWYRLSHQGDRRILARLGLFEHDGICRLQSVGTLKQFRRRGFGSALVNYAIGEAHRRGSSGLVLSVEAESAAQSMYRHVGFRDLGTDLWVMRYP